MKLVSKAAMMARVNEGSHSFTCHPRVYPRMEWAIPPLLPSRRGQEAELAWVADYVPRWYARRTVSHISTNRPIVRWPGSNSRPLSRKFDALNT